MRIKQSAALVTVLAALSYGVAARAADDYPVRPVRILTGGVGGANDILARLLAKELGEVWNKSVIVENRTSGIIPIDIVAKASPDGYSLLLNGNSIWTVPLLEKVPYDPVKDFATITVATSSPSLLVVNPSVAVKSVAELIALAKAKPGQLNYGAGATGSSNHLATELFKSMAGVNIVRIQYKNVSQNIIALIAGEVQMLISSTVSLAPHVAAGKLRALAVTSAQPSALAPGLPTVAQSGVPGYQAEQMLNLFAPAKTAASIVNIVNRDVIRVLNRPDIKEKLFNSGVETVGSTPQQLAAIMKTEMVRLGKVIKDAGIRGE